MLMSKVAFITGAGRGIGHAIALKFAKEKIDLILNYQGSKEKCEALKVECESLGVKAICIQGNVSSSEDVTRMMNETLLEYDHIDILVNNAGITRDNLMLRMSEEDFDNVIATNLKGTFLMVKAVSKIMMKKRSGKIINMSSVIGLNGNAGQVNYAASKAGVIGITKSAAKELAARNICVNAIAPGFIESDMTNAIPEAAQTAILTNIPLKRMGTGEDIANMAYFLASEESDYITGQVFQVDGGMFI
ncbi:MAG: 3-oxoacyl-[acyl-carrier-protein] reductase [Erysipelotrichaceae bacterium]